MPNDSDLLCDKCNQPFMPEEGCYIGPADPNDTTCDIMAAYTWNWKQLCPDCNR